MKKKNILNNSENINKRESLATCWDIKNTITFIFYKIQMK